MIMNDFAPIDVLGVNISRPGIIGVDFNDSTQPVTFEISSSLGINYILFLNLIFSLNCYVL